MILKHMLNQSAALDLMFQALADPSRRVMVERLTRGPASVSELAKPLAMSLPAVVQHLQVLESSGLVRSEKVGRVRTCHIEAKVLRSAEHGSPSGVRCGNTGSTASARFSPPARTSRPRSQRISHGVPSCP